MNAHAPQRISRGTAGQAAIPVRYFLYFLNKEKDWAASVGSNRIVESIVTRYSMQFLVINYYSDTAILLY